MSPGKPSVWTGAQQDSDDLLWCLDALGALRVVLGKAKGPEFTAPGLCWVVRFKEAVKMNEKGKSPWLAPNCASLKPRLYQIGMTELSGEPEEQNIDFITC